MTDEQPRSESVTVDQAAIILGNLHRDTVMRLITSGKLPAFRVGRLVRIAKVDLVKFREAQRYLGPEKPGGPKPAQ